MTHALRFVSMLSVVSLLAAGTHASPGVGQPLTSGHSARLSEQNATPQQWAVEALKSGKLRPWERIWAKKMAAGQVGRSAKVWFSNYGPWDPAQFRGADYHIACNRLPIGTVVWLSADRRLKVVTNTGAHYNDTWARAPVWHGKKKPVCEYWADRWTARRRDDNAAQRVWIVGKAVWPK